MMTSSIVVRAYCPWLTGKGRRVAILHKMQWGGGGGGGVIIKKIFFFFLRWKPFHVYYSKTFILSSSELKYCSTPQFTKQKTIKK